MIVKMKAGLIAATGKDECVAGGCDHAFDVRGRHQRCGTGSVRQCDFEAVEGGEFFVDGADLEGESGRWPSVGRSVPAGHGIATLRPRFGRHVLELGSGPDDLFDVGYRGMHWKKRLE